MDYHSPYFFGYLIGVIHLLGAIAALHAVFTVRTAQGAIAWALSLLFIPYFTLIPYLVFGSRTFDAYIQARRQANREMHVAMADLNWRPWSKRPWQPAIQNPMPRCGRCPSWDACRAWPTIRCVC